MKNLCVLLAFVFSLTANASYVVPDGGITAPKLAASAADSLGLYNAGISATASSNTLVVSLVQADGSSAPTTGSGTVRARFRSATATSGAATIKDFTAANSITLAAADSIGATASAATKLYVYLISDTTSEICLSASQFDEQVVQSASALTGSADTDRTKLWCTSVHTSRPVRLLGALTAIWSNPNWASPSLVVPVPAQKIPVIYQGWWTSCSVSSGTWTANTMYDMGGSGWGASCELVPTLNVNAGSVTFTGTDPHGVNLAFNAVAGDSFEACVDAIGYPTAINTYVNYELQDTNNNTMGGAKAWYTVVNQPANYEICGFMTATTTGAQQIHFLFGLTSSTGAAFNNSGSIMSRTGGWRFKKVN